MDAFSISVDENKLNITNWNSIKLIKYKNVNDEDKANRKPYTAIIASRKYYFKENTQGYIY